MGLLLILLAAFLLRVWGIGFGLPGHPIIDEAGLIYEALYAGAHHLAPVRYVYAPLIPYILLFEYGIYYIFGRLSGLFTTPESFLITYLKNPTTLYLMGRMTMVILSTATVWSVWYTAKKFFGKNTGLISAFFMAVVFLNTKEAHYIKQDVPMTFFLMPVFYYSLSLFENGKVKTVIKAGVTTALAAAAKYLGLLVVPLVLAGIFLSAKKNIGKYLLIFTLSAAVAFLIIHPYFALKIGEIIPNMWQMKQTIAVSYPEHLQGHAVWWWYMFVHLPRGMGIPLYGLSFLGFVLCVGKGFHNRRYFLLPVLPALFFLTIGWWSKIHFARYGLMVIPFMTISAGILIDEMLNLVRNQKYRRVLLAIICLALGFPSIIRSVKFDLLMTVPDTRLQAKSWIEKTIPKSTKILLDSTFRPEYPADFNASLLLDPVGINRRISDARSRNIDSGYLKALYQANLNSIGYDITASIRPDRELNIFTDNQTEIPDAVFYYNQGIEYLVLTDWIIQSGMKQSFIDSLFRHYSLIKEFTPNPKFPMDPHFIQIDYPVLDSVDIKNTNLIFGPTIQIYKMKNMTGL